MCEDLEARKGKHKDGSCTPGTHTPQQDSTNAARIAGRPEQWRGDS